MSKTLNAQEVKPFACSPRQPFSNSSPVGDQYLYKVDLSFDEKGKKISKIGKKLDFDALIQASLPSTDITAIIAKAKLGDETVLNVHENGFVGDSTQLPKDIYDYKRMNDLYDKVSESFNSLPAEIKALFDNDSGTYLNSILSNQANKVITDYLEKNKLQESEVNDNA